MKLKLIKLYLKKSKFDYRNKVLNFEFDSKIFAKKIQKKVFLSGDISRVFKVNFKIKCERFLLLFFRFFFFLRLRFKFLDLLYKDKKFLNFFTLNGLFCKSHINLDFYLKGNFFVFYFNKLEVLDQMLLLLDKPNLITNNLYEGDNGLVLNTFHEKLSVYFLRGFGKKIRFFRDDFKVLLSIFNGLFFSSCIIFDLYLFIYYFLNFIVSFYYYLFGRVIAMLNYCTVQKI